MKIDDVILYAGGPPFNARKDQPPPKILDTPTKSVFVGAHYNYPRLVDIQIQLSILRPDITVELNYNTHVEKLIALTKTLI